MSQILSIIVIPFNNFLFKPEESKGDPKKKEEEKKDCTTTDDLASSSIGDFHLGMSAIQILFSFIEIYQFILSTRVACVYLVSAVLLIKTSFLMTIMQPNMG